MRQLPLTNTILAFHTLHQATISNQQTLMVISTLQQLLEQLKLLMVSNLVESLQGAGLSNVTTINRTITTTTTTETQSIFGQ